MSDFDLPSPEEQRRSIERIERRQATRAQEALARELRLAREANARLASKRPSGSSWESIVAKYRQWQGRTGNADRRMPKAELAAELAISERTLDAWLRDRCGVRIASYHDVHALVLSEP